MACDEFSDELKCKCHGKHKRCSFSSKLHVQLNGGQTTRRAARYPLRLARVLAMELFFAWKPIQEGGCFVDLCGGSGVVGMALNFFLKAPAIIVDTRYRRDDNICDIAFQERFRKFSEKLLIAGVMFAFLRSTFSVAQSRAGTAIRSQTHPRGVKGPLTEAQRERFRDGNRLLDAGVAILEMCNSNQVPYIFENPQSSYVCWDPQLQQQLKKGVPHTVHQCAYGARWRNATTFAFLNIR